jgi:hypothetical protein
MMSETDRFLARLEMSKSNGDHMNNLSAFQPVSPAYSTGLAARGANTSITELEAKMEIALLKLSEGIKQTEKEILDGIISSGTSQQRHTSIVASALLKEVTILVEKHSGNHAIPDKFMEDLARLNADAQQIFGNK